VVPPNIGVPSPNRVPWGGGKVGGAKGLRAPNPNPVNPTPPALLLLSSSSSDVSLYTLSSLSCFFNAFFG